MTAADHRFVVTAAMFPRARPGGLRGVHLASGSAPRLNQLPGFRPYVYRGTGRDELTPLLGVTMCRPCLGRHAFRACDDPYCPCACNDGSQP